MGSRINRSAKIEAVNGMMAPSPNADVRIGSARKLMFGSVVACAYIAASAKVPRRQPRSIAMATRLIVQQPSK